MREVKLVQGTAARMRTTATEPNRATRPKQKSQDGSPCYNFWCDINDVPLIIKESINRLIVLHFNTASRIGMIFLIPGCEKWSPVQATAARMRTTATEPSRIPRPQ